MKPLLAAVLLFLASAAAAAGRMPPPRAGERVLILAPHPDDETLCCAGYISESVRAGAMVSIVWLTSGDGYKRDAIEVFDTLFPGPAEFRKLGAMRMDEARAAAATLGVAPRDVYFLGYPDGGLLRLFDENYLRPLRSATTAWDAVGYGAAYRPGAPYTGLALKKLLSRIFRQVRPDLILLPLLADEHPDHLATSLFGKDVAASLGLSGRVCGWVVHSGYDWPSPQGFYPDYPLTAPGANYHWLSFRLSKKDEALKKAAVSAYKTQMLTMRRFLLSFVRENELFSCDGGVW